MTEVEDDKELEKIFRKSQLGEEITVTFTMYELSENRDDLGALVRRSSEVREALELIDAEEELAAAMDVVTRLRNNLMDRQAVRKRRSEN